MATRKTILVSIKDYANKIETTKQNVTTRMKLRTLKAMVDFEHYGGFCMIRVYEDEYKKLNKNNR